MKHIAAERPDHPTHPCMIGSTLSHYEITTVLGRGSMAVFSSRGRRSRPPSCIIRTSSVLEIDEAILKDARVTKSAHRMGRAKNIVHRDINSANVMLTEDGIAKVLDFGLAKTNQSTMLTRMGSTLGTVAYMSPEQAVVYSILNEQPQPLSALRTGVPMQLEWIVNKLLAKHADYRYQTAAHLLADLKSL